MARRFTVWEAQRTIPQIREWMQEAIALKAQYDEAEQAVQALATRIAMLGGVLVDREKASDNKSRRDAAGHRLRAILENFEQYGVLVKDLEKGLVDFPTLFRGEEVYLCWKVDEDSIAFWHGTQEGFAGRKAIDQDFLDHHEGDQPN